MACRRCGASIEHRGSAPPPDAPVWHVLIAGAPVGPLRTALVVDLLERGSLGDAPMIWRAGSVAWRPIAELEPFAAPYRRWRQTRESTAVSSIDPNLTVSRTDDPSPTATRPIGAVEFVMEIDDEPAYHPRERVSRLPAPREESTGVFSLDALRTQAQSPVLAPPELPAFPPAALAAIAVPVAPPPAEPAPIAPTSPRRASPHVGLYVMLFLLMASIGGLAALVLLRDSEPGASSTEPEPADLVAM